jgi:hypothetical protein
MAAWNRVRPCLWLAAGYGIAGLAGYGASLAHLPLAWVLGPLIVAAVLGIAGLELPAPALPRRAGQLIIGATVGLGMTSAVVTGLLEWLPLMIFTAFFSVFVSASLSTALASLGRIDGKTAFFAVLPGGLSEMGNIGATIGARMEPIALIQALRVAVIVLVVPPLMVARGLNQAPIPLLDLSPTMTALSVTVSLCGASIAHLVRLNNPWMIGALISTGILTAVGLVEGRMPHLLFVVGQILIGYNIGTRFRRDAVRKLPRVAAVGMIVIVAMMVLMALYAFAINQLLGLDLATGILSSSPGGTAEMAATAQALHLPVALITAFHVTRSVFVNGFATYYWRGLAAIGYLGALERILEKIFGPK